MIQMHTMLNAADNSGARSRHVHQGARRLQAPLRRIGDVIKVSIKDAAPRGR